MHRNMFHKNIVKFPEDMQVNNYTTTTTPTTTTNTTTTTATTSWWRSIVVRTSILAGGLSLSCARLMDCRVTTLWVRRPLSVNQQGQLSLPYLLGWLNE